MLRAFAACFGVTLGAGLAVADTVRANEAQVAASNVATPYAHVASASRTGRKPNILFVIMDDVGVDQMNAMGYGGITPPRTPTIDEIAESGVRFRNTWSMPECSNGRMALLTGRFPFRTDVYQAIGQSDLANSHVSPYDGPDTPAASLASTTLADRRTTRPATEARGNWAGTIFTAGSPACRLPSTRPPAGLAMKEPTSADMSRRWTAR